MAFLLTVAIVVPAFSFLIFYLYRNLFCFKYFKRLGISGPEPHWLYGSLHEIWAQEDRRQLFDSWTKKYGSFFGFYEGKTPILVTSSPEAVEQMCVKQFNVFPGRQMAPIMPDPRKYPDSPFTNISSLWGEQWKRLRTITNPGFSTGKLRGYAPLIDKSQDELTKLFQEKAAAKTPFEMLQQLQCLALDVISEVAFGIELNSVQKRGADNPVLPRFRNILSLIEKDSKIMRLCYAVPEIVPLIQQLVSWQMRSSAGILKSFSELAVVASSVIAQRRNNPDQKRSDLLQMLIDSAAETEDGSMLRPLSEIEVTSQAIQFFVAGTMTTSSAMSFGSYALATHQEYQQKLYEEIIANFPDSKIKPDYDTVMKMPYLDWFIHETLRLYPIAPFAVTRFITEPTVICGIPVDKTVTMLINIHAIHNDPELWGPVDPGLFYPGRFSPDYPTTATRPSSAFLSFGFGPRLCLGMRLALFEMKLTLINLVRRFRVLPPEGGYPNGLQVVTTVLMLPKNGVWVRLEER